MKILSIFSAILFLAVAISAGTKSVVQKNWEMDKILALKAGIRVSIKTVDYLCNGQPEITIKIPSRFKERSYKSSGFTVFKDNSLLISSNLVSGKVDEIYSEVFFCLNQNLLLSTQVEIHYGIGEHITDTLILKNMAMYANQSNS